MHTYIRALPVLSTHNMCVYSVLAPAAGFGRARLRCNTIHNVADAQARIRSSQFLAANGYLTPYQI